MATGPLTAWDALAALAPIIGGGGISGVIIAVLGYFKAAREGKLPATVAPHGGLGIATLYADRVVLEDLSEHFRCLCVEVAHLHRALASDGARLEKLVDELRDIRRAIEDVRPGK